MPVDLEKAVLGADADPEVLSIVPSGLGKSFCARYYINNFVEAQGMGLIVQAVPETELDARTEDMANRMSGFQ